MRSLRLPLPFSFLSLTAGLVAVLAVVYVALIAMVMTYAAATVEFTQSIKNDEAALAVLEAEYLAQISRIQSTDYESAGYRLPVATIFVPKTSVTALR